MKHAFRSIRINVTKYVTFATKSSQVYLSKVHKALVKKHSERREIN